MSETRGRMFAAQGSPEKYIKQSGKPTVTATARAKIANCIAAFIVGSPKGDLGHLGDLLPKRGLLKVTFLFKSLLSERKDYGDVLYTSFAAHEA